MKNINPEAINRKISPYSKEARENLERKKIKLNQEISKNQEKNNLSNGSPSKKKKWHSVVYLLAAIVLLVGALIIYKAWIFKNKVIVENTDGTSPILNAKNPDEITAEMVEKDGDTRINVLITGIGGRGHDGGSLTDSIQVISIDPFNNQAAIVSLPRDFYLLLDKKIGYKLNTVYQTGERNGKGGGALMKKAVGEILDLKVHYFINLDFEGFVKIIDKLGDVTVNVTKPINDPYYPDRKLEGFEPFYLKAGVQELNGATALKYARSRKTTSDFDRSKRQQDLIIAVREKALSLGTLANPAKINEIINILGDHLKTDIQLSEINQLAKHYRKIESNQVKTLVIDNSSNGPLNNSLVEGSYVLIPKLGINRFTDIQNSAHKILLDPKIVQEGAKIKVFYLKSREKGAKEMIDKLSAYGYTISNGGVINSSENREVDELIAHRSGFDFTTTYLKNRYSNLSEGKKLNDETEADIDIYLGDKK